MTRSGLDFSHMYPRSGHTEAHAFHGALNILVAHEPAPNTSVQKIFDAQESDTYIDTDHIGVHPKLLIFPIWIKGIGEAVALVYFGAIYVVHLAQHGQANSGANISEPAAAQGTSVPLIGLRLVVDPQLM